MRIDQYSGFKVRRHVAALIARIIVALMVVGALYGGSLVSAPVAGASIQRAPMARAPMALGPVSLAAVGTGFGYNGEHRKPFYVFGHNPNMTSDVTGDLNAGANALEPDVFRFEDSAFAPPPDGRNINSTIKPGQSGLFMYHGDTFITRMPTSVEDWLDFVWHKVHDDNATVAFIAFDIKTAAAYPQYGTALLQAVRTHLNHDGVKVNVIFSVGKFSDLHQGVFDDILKPPGLDDREGVMVDGEDDPGAVYRELAGKGATGHIGYGDGSLGFTVGSASGVLTGIEKAAWGRASQGSPLAIPYAFLIATDHDMNVLITNGADGEIPDGISPVQDQGETERQIHSLAVIVNDVRRQDVYMATGAENPFHPRVEAYALRVDTQDKFLAGTSANLTFSLTGCNGTSSIQIDASYRDHFVRAGRDYVTLPSKDLGALQSISVSTDGSSWGAGPIQVSSASWGIPFSDNRVADFHFKPNVEPTAPQTIKVPDGEVWGHPCDPGITASGTAFSAIEGVDSLGQVASFTDPDAGAYASEYAATIDWGDGTSSPGKVDGPKGGPFTVSGTRRYLEEGSQTATVTILDTSTEVVHKTPNPVTVTAGVTVGDAHLTAASRPVSATEGALFAGTVADITDANPAGTAADLTATIDWGDGTSSPRPVSGSGTTFTVSGTHTYAEEGIYNVTTRVADVGGSTAAASGPASVTDAALAATGRTVYTTNPVTNVTLASFTDADPAGTATDYTATIDWGDGSPTSAGTVSAPTSAGGPFTVAGSHTYKPTGPFNLATKLHICDTGGSCTDATSLVKLLYMTGHSVALHSAVSLLGTLPGGSTTVSDTGEVANTGATNTSLTAVMADLGLVRANGLNASVQTTVGKSVAQSSVSQVTMNALGIPAIMIQGATSTSTTTCAGSTGAGQIASLTIAGVAVATAGAGPNSTIQVGILTIVLNEQTVVDGGLLVNAVHITIPGQLDQVVSSSRSDIHNCPP